MEKERICITLAESKEDEKASKFIIWKQNLCFNGEFVKILFLHIKSCLWEIPFNWQTNEKFFYKRLFTLKIG